MTKPFELKNGTILLSTEAPGGLYNATQLKKIAAISDANMAIVKATEDQRLALFVKAEDAAKIAGELKSIGLGIRHYQDGLHQPTACVGELCPDHEQDALGSAMHLTKELADIQLATPLKIGLNGCAACCVPCHTLDVSILGDSSGYRISLGGKNSQLPEMASFIAEGVPAEELSSLIKKVVLLYREHAQDGENLQAVMERVGAGDFIKALAPYSQDASAGSDDPFAGVTNQEAAAVPLEETLDTPLAVDGLEVEASEDVPLEEGALDSLVFADVSQGLDEGIEDLTSEPENLKEDSLDFDDSKTSELELLAQDDDEALLKDDLTIGGDEFGELKDDFSAASTELGGDLTEEIPFTDDDLLMEDKAPAKTEKAAPAPLAMGAESCDPEVAEEASEDFEAQLDESIAEEENIRALEEPNDIIQARDEALDLIEEQIAKESVTDEDAFTPATLGANLQTTARRKSSSASTSRSSQDLCGVAMDERGRLILEFEGGATVAVDPARFNNGTKTLKIGGQVIQVTSSPEGYHVETDGLAFFQPLGGFHAAA